MNDNFFMISRFFGSRLIMLASDCAALFGTALAVGLLRENWGGALDFTLHFSLMLFLLVAPVINYFNDLYAKVPPARPEELRCLAIATSLAYLGVAIFSFLTRPDDLPSRMVFLLSWVFSLATVPLLRALFRHFFAHKDWWGLPAVLFGQGMLVEKLVQELRARPDTGLQPLAVAGVDAVLGFVEDTRVPAQTDCKEQAEHKEQVGQSGLLHVHSLDDLNGFLQQHPQACALVILSTEESEARRAALLEVATRLFPMVILVPGEFVTGSIPYCIRPMEIGSVLGLKVRQNLLDPRRLALKRLMDVVLSVVGGVLLVPVLAAICACICIESPGSPFFWHKRLGRGGGGIRILKFRTMVPHAEACLAEYLAANPAMKKEWAADQKLRHDPRITKVGAFLRRTSLDEVPQIWNVLCGEMSLVGPRPIVTNEIPRYGAAYDSYIRVRPGITGLWQVSGRNDLSYPHRVMLDRYYICNWSTWLDLLILARTIPVVFGRKGAY